VSSAAVQVAGSTRRLSSDRRAATIERLAEAAVDELAAAGHRDLTVRNVARRAGVAPATAYTYFASKDHLIAEVYWRRLQGQPERAVDRRKSAATRAADVLLDFALSVADETELAAACTVALLADEPEVRELRARIGTELRRRLVAAIGAGADPVVLAALELTTTGALVQVGTGHLDYDALPALVTGIASRLLGRNP
jgi:AcrR family transcriptional regulator